MTTAEEKLCAGDPQPSWVTPESALRSGRSAVSSVSGQFPVRGWAQHFHTFPEDFILFRKVFIILYKFSILSGPNV